MENKWLTIVGVIVIIIITVGVIVRGPALQEQAQQQKDSMPKQYSTPPAMMLEDGVDYQAIVETNKGDITIDLHENDTPITVNNFVFLANEGFYDGVPFHRVMKGFMIQSGDPTGTGAGGPGYRFEDEDFEGSYDIGTVAMANAGADTNGSQFFIMHGDFSDPEDGLPPAYTIFGNVTDGMDVVDAIASVEVTANSQGERSKPTDEVFIDTVEIVKK